MRILFVLFFVILSTATHSQNKGRVSVFTSGDEGHKTYRIPAIIQLPDGDLLAFCDQNEAFVNAAKDMDVGEDAVATNGDTGMEAEVPVIAELDTLDGKPNIVDSIWEGRPDLPKNPFRVQVCSPFLFHYHCNVVV